MTHEMLEKLKSFEEEGELGEMKSLLAKRMDQAIDESWARGWAEGKEQGLERQWAIVLRPAARKADTAARFETLPAAVDDPGRFAGLGGRVVDSDDGEELLSRVTGVAKLR